MRVDINICTKDRVTDLLLLLQGLRTQSFQDFDIYILDDASRTPINQVFELQHMITRLKLEGHRIHVMRVERSLGASRGRQHLAEECIENGRGELICRLDDDVIPEPDYLLKLRRDIKGGYDLVSGVTPHIGMPATVREVKFVQPVINAMAIDNQGELIYMGDDCGYKYLDEVTIPCHHFRSSCMYKKEMHEKVSYEENLAQHSWREEAFFSIRAILAGYNMAVNTQAVIWHFANPVGGERSHAEIQKDMQINEEMLRREIKKAFKKHGDFFAKYNKRLDLGKIPIILNKNTNLLIGGAK